VARAAAGASRARAAPLAALGMLPPVAPAAPQAWRRPAPSWVSPATGATAATAPFGGNGGPAGVAGSAGAGGPGGVGGAAYGGGIAIFGAVGGVTLPRSIAGKSPGGPDAASGDQVVLSWSSISSNGAFRGPGGNGGLAAMAGLDFSVAPAAVAAAASDL
jgi:DNA polymerase-3 subunit gamma/tau